LDADERRKIGFLMRAQFNARLAAKINASLFKVL